MELHGIQPNDGRKEITCADCGHAYLIANGQQSSRCGACGNIAFFAESPNLDSLSQNIVTKRVLPRLEKISDAPLDPLAAFLVTPDGNAVEALRMRYQVEWQLWAMLVKNFQDPAFHSAYLCQTTALNELERAAERYRDHRAVMALLADGRWQAEVSELMLSRVEAISVSRMRAGGGGWWTQLPARMFILPLESWAFEIAWIAFGLMAIVKIFSLVWWK